MPWWVGWSANIAAMPAPNAALVKLDLWPNTAPESMRPLLYGFATQLASLSFSGVCASVLIGHQTPIPPTDHHWHKEFFKSPPLKTFGTSGAGSCALGGMGKSMAAKLLRCLCINCRAFNL